MVKWSSSISQSMTPIFSIPTYFSCSLCWHHSCDHFHLINCPLLKCKLLNCHPAVVVREFKWTSSSRFLSEPSTIQLSNYVSLHSKVSAFWSSASSSSIYLLPTWLQGDGALLEGEGFSGHYKSHYFVGFTTGAFIRDGCLIFAGLDVILSDISDADDVVVSVRVVVVNASFV